MNSFAFKQLIRLTFKTFFAAMVIALLNPLFASDAKGQRLDSYSVNLAIKNASVVEVIKKIEDQTQFKFVYGNEVGQLNDRFHFNEGNMSLRSILEIMAMEAGLTFKRIDKNISVNIRPKAKVKVVEPVPAEITGTVTDEQGEPLPGATIYVKGTTNGTTTDFDGNFALRVEDSNAILVVSYIGFTTREVPLNGNTVIDIVLLQSSAQLEEVVVTALGIKKEKRKVGYATQEVAGESLQKAIAPNIAESLTGKVAGLTVINNNADFFSDPQIFLRGRKPLIVVDGVPRPESNLWDISSDDIENVSVLKSGAASALYGSLGANGAVQITMKSGRGTEKVKVSVNSSTTFQNGFLRIPRAQTQYGPGNTGNYRYGGGFAGGDGLTLGGGINDVDYSIWGPKFDGRLIEQFDSPIDPVTGYRIPTPWVSRGEHNLKNFMEVGLVTSNNVSVQGSSEKGSFVISNTYRYAKASTPGQRLDNNTFRLRGNLVLSDKINIDGSLQYNFQNSDNRLRAQYGPTSPIYLISLWGGANWDIRNFEDVWIPGKEGISQRFVESWRYNNPYAIAHNWRKPYTKNDVLAFLKVNFNITDKLTAYVRSTLNSYTEIDNEEISKSIYNYDIPDRGGRFRYNNERLFENNTDFLVTYSDKFVNEELSLDAALGANQRYVKRERESATTTQLIIPEVFTLDNSVDEVVPVSRKHLIGIYSGYTYVDLAYKNYLFLGATGRMDKISTLPSKNDTFFYPSVYSSIVLSDILNLPKPIDYLKLRTAYAEVGNGVISNNRNANPLSVAYNHSASYSTGRYRDLPIANFDDVLANPNLLPEKNSTLEYGAEMKLFNGRFGIDFSYYENTYGPEIFDQNLSDASTYSAVRLNGRKTERRGIDFAINAIPVQTDNFTWSTIFNFDKGKEYLLSLPPLADGTLPEWEGERDDNFRTRVGTALGDYWYYVWQRSPDGQLIINSNTGLPMRTDFKVNTGNTQPDFIASLNNTFTYKNLSLNVLVDGRFGGVIQDRYERDLWRTGSHPDAIHPERELSNIAYANGTNPRTMLIEGVNVASGEVTYDPDGNILSDTRTYETNATMVDYQNWAQRYKADWPSVIKDKTFVKLREVTLTYNFPRRILEKTFFDNASVSLIGRNLLYWTKDDFYGDLDTYTLILGDTGLQQPSQRSYGFNLNFTF